MKSRERSRSARNFLQLALGTAASRLAGFLRELATAAWVGGGAAMDRFVVAFTIPTLFRRILGEEMFERAIMPSVKRGHESGQTRRAWVMTWQLLSITLGFLLIAWGVMWLNAGSLASLVGPGIVSREGEENLIPLVRLVLPFLIIIGTAAYIGAILLFTERVKAYSLAPIGLSVGIILILVLHGKDSGAESVAIGYLIGGVMQLVILAVVLFSPRFRRSQDMTFGLRGGLTISEAKSISKQSIWVLLQSLAQKSVEVVDRNLASSIAAGRVSALWFAFRLIHLPEAILGLAAGRAGVAAMTEKFAKGDRQGLADLVHHALERTTAVVAPVAAFSWIASQELAAVVYQRGEFGESEVLATAWAFKFYALGLPAIAATSVLSRYHATGSRNGFTLVVSILAAVINIILNYCLVRTSLLHGGIALATSISFVVGTVLLWIGFVRWLQATGRRECLIMCLKIVLLSVVLGLLLSPLRTWSVGWNLPGWNLLNLPALIRLAFLAPAAFVIHTITRKMAGL